MWLYRKKKHKFNDSRLFWRSYPILRLIVLFSYKRRLEISSKSVKTFISLNCLIYKSGTQISCRSPVVNSIYLIDSVSVFVLIRWSSQITWRNTSNDISWKISFCEKSLEYKIWMLRSYYLTVPTSLFSSTADIRFMYNEIETSVKLPLSNNNRLINIW